MNPTRRLRKFGQISWSEKVLFLQALSLLAVVATGLRIIPWLQLQAFLRKQITKRPYARVRPSTQNIGWAVHAAGRLIPNATCLPQALVAEYFLAREGYPAQLQLGVARQKTGTLEAHAWVISDSEVIVGNLRDLDGFVPLSQNQHDSGSVFENFWAGLRPEAKLLLLCARTRVNSAEAKEIANLLQGTIDWQSLLRMAYEHKIAALVLRNLDAVAVTAMPQNIRKELKQQIQIDIQGNLALTKELLDLLRLFEKQEILAIPYKGPVLASSVYHDLAIRSFGDIDILVHERDIVRAMNVLVSCGYEIIRPHNIAQADERLRSLWVNRLVKKSPWAYQIVLWHPDRQGIVELHWRFTPKYIFPETAQPIWGELEPVALGSDTVRSLSPENLLWFLCLHATRHQWKELRWISDVAELLREYPNLDWEKVIARANTWGLERKLYLGTLLAHTLLNAPLPMAVEARLRSTPHVEKLAHQVLDRLFADPQRRTVSANWRRLVFQLQAMDRLANRFWYMLRFFKGIDREVTLERKFIKRFSLLSISSRLLQRNH